MPFRPLKIIGSIGKGIFRGIKDVLPIPQVEDSIKDLKIRKVLQEVRAVQAPNSDQVYTDGNIRDIVKRAVDILDDGKENDSPEKAKVETITRIVMGFIPVGFWVLRGVVTGDWILF